MEKRVAWSLVFLLIFSSIPPIGVNAQVTSGIESKPNSVIPPMNKAKVGEVIEGRTENSKIYYNADGTYTKNI